MKQPAASLTALPALLSPAHWLIDVNPEAGEDNVVVQVNSSRGKTYVAAYIFASSSYSVPGLAAKALVMINEKEEEYKRQALKVMP